MDINPIKPKDMEFMVRHWYKEVFLPFDIIQEITIWTGIVILMVEQFERLQIPPHIRINITSWCHLSIDIGVARIDGVMFRLILNNFTRAVENLWLLCAKPMDIETETFLSADITGRIEPYEKSNGKLYEEKSFAEYINNECYPSEIKQYLIPYCPALYISQPLQKPVKRIILCLSFGDLIVESFAYLLNIFIYLYVLYIFIYMIFLHVLYNIHSGLPL